ncbi:MAG: hypothetical protein GX820_01585, partial [Bacteroidales bacterium]|nr:hypothetical protein [Bacteroidales bacterium]
VLNSIPDQKTSFTIGKDITVLLPKSINIDIGTPVEIENKETGNRFIPGITITNQGNRIEPGNMINEAGHYRVINNEKNLTSFAFNYNRNESDLKYTGIDELKDKLKSAGLTNASVISGTEKAFSNIVEEINKGKQLWKYCIAAALLFILAEVLISRFMQ